MKIAALVLAAGRSRRFGEDNKLLSEASGLPLIRHVLHAVDHPEISECVLVTGSAHDQVVAAAGAGRWRSVRNDHPDLGLSSSISAGLAAFDPSIDGAMIVLGDMPGISRDLVARLCEAFIENKGARCVYPQNADGQQGHPVIWPKKRFPDLMKLSGDKGGRDILKAHPKLCAPVPVEGNGAFLDIDTPADLAAFRRSVKS